jgi:transforming growth factor-beta-induced protein
MLNMKNRIVYKAASVFLFVVVALGCSDQFDEPASPTGTTLAFIADGNVELDIFAAAMAKTNLLASLGNTNSGEYTVFAPHDSAFAAFFRSTLAKTAAYGEAQVLKYISDTLSATSALTIATLAARLNYHVVSSKIASSMITGGNGFTTLNGARLSLSKSGSNFYVNATAAKIVGADSEGANGTIHVINRVLTAVGTANVLAVAGLSLTVSYATNPPLIGGGSENGGDGNGNNYNILAYVLRRTSLATTLLPNATPLPDFTLFAPTDDAFRAYLGDAAAVTADLENAAIQTLKGKTIDELSNLLKYHIVSGRILSTDLAEGQIVNSLLGGKSFTVRKTGVNVSITDVSASTVNDAAVTSPNVLTNAGVLHRLNAVLLPQ